MYTHPDFTPRGVGRLILTLVGDGSSRRGVHADAVARHRRRLPLCGAYGFEPLEEVVIDSGGVPIPSVHKTRPMG